MKDLNVIGTTINSVRFDNNLMPNQKISLEHKYSFTVRYSPKGVCTGVFKAEICDKDDDKKLNINLVMSVHFRYNPAISKEELHFKCYDEAFPYVRAYVNTITSCGGIPPIHIPYIDISNQTVYRVENNDEEDEE